MTHDRATAPTRLGDTGITSAWADRFASDWIAAWNARDLQALLAHYREDVVFHSPFALRFAPESAGVVRGRTALGRYWQRALEANPDLHFLPAQAVIPGLDSLALVYTSVRDLQAIEVMQFDDEGLVVRAHCHYRRKDLSA